jgi:hypothetical protein
MTVMRRLESREYVHFGSVAGGQLALISLLFTYHAGHYLKFFCLDFYFTEIPGLFVGRDEDEGEFGV